MTSLPPSFVHKSEGSGKLCRGVFQSAGVFRDFFLLFFFLEPHVSLVVTFIGYLSECEYKIMLERLTTINDQVSNHEAKGKN